MNHRPQDYAGVSGSGAKRVVLGPPTTDVCSSTMYTLSVRLNAHRMISAKTSDYVNSWRSVPWSCQMVRHLPVRCGGYTRTEPVPGSGNDPPDSSTRRG